MVQTIWPWYANLKKRLVKRPKLYFRDTGILHALLSIETFDQLYNHPKLGSSWECFAIRTLFRIIGKSDNQYFSGVLILVLKLAYVWLCIADCFVAHSVYSLQRPNNQTIYKGF